MGDDNNEEGWREKGLEWCFISSSLVMDPMSPDETRVAKELIRAGGPDGIRRWCWMPNKALNSQLDPPSGMAVEMTGRCNVLRNLFHPTKMFYGSLAVPLTHKAYEVVCSNMRSKDYIRKLASSMASCINAVHFPQGRGNFAGLYTRSVKIRTGSTKELWLVVQCGDENASMQLHSSIENKLATMKVGSIIRDIDLSPALSCATDARVDCITSLARCCIDPDKPGEVELSDFGMDGGAVRDAIMNSPVVMAAKANGGGDKINQKQRNRHEQGAHSTDDDSDTSDNDNEDEDEEDSDVDDYISKTKRRLKHEKMTASCFVECFNDMDRVVATETISYMLELASPTLKHGASASASDDDEDDDDDGDNTVELDEHFNIILVGERGPEESNKKSAPVPRQRHSLVYYAGCTPVNKRGHGGVIVCENPYKGVTVLIGEPCPESVFGRGWEAPRNYLGAFPTGMGRTIGQKAEIVKAELTKRKLARVKKNNGGGSSSSDSANKEEGRRTNVCIVWGGPSSSSSSRDHPLLKEQSYRMRNYTFIDRERNLGHTKGADVSLFLLCV